MYAEALFKYFQKFLVAIQQKTLNKLFKLVAFHYMSLANNFFGHLYPLLCY